jgi:hypothetical protein
VTEEIIEELIQESANALEMHTDEYAEMLFANEFK